MISTNVLSPNIFIVTDKTVQVGNTDRQIVSALAGGKSSEYFPKNKMFCTLLKGYEVVSKIVRILLLHFCWPKEQHL